MEQREYLLYWSIKCRGDWNDIYQKISEKTEIDFKDAEKCIKEFKGNYITLLDDDYPESLKNMTKPPFVLYYIGDISLISDSHNKLAVVGSRKFTEYGEKVTNHFVSKLAKDFVIISGLAIGIDSIAHRCAISSGGKTVAVLGNGINFIYIPENEELYKEISEKYLVISEYPPNVEPCPIKFPIRNRIIAGLCNDLLVTEGKVRSGTQVTACLMARKGGNVCCVPTCIGEESICNKLISEGAYLVETPEDVYEIANVVIKKPVFEN